jgi:hypothetical protein
MRKNLNKEMRMKMLKQQTESFGEQGLEENIKLIDAMSDFLNYERRVKVLVNLDESQVPQFEKHMAKFFKKHGYRANILR